MTWFRVALFACSITALFAGCAKSCAHGCTATTLAGEMHAQVPELSGIVASRSYPGVFWAHGDSGNEAALWAIDREGRTLGRFEVQATNVDWEDIARDDQGRLYVGDIGNNLQMRGDLVVYVVDEPDPRGKSRALPVRAALSFRYPDDDAVLDTRMRFDAEALFFSDGHLYLLTKRWRDTLTTLYRFAHLTGGQDMQVLERIGDFDLRVRDKQRNALVTGADVNAEGTRLAVLTYQRIFVFALKGGTIGDRLWIGNTVGHDGAEAVTWDGNALLVGHEDGTLRRILPREPPLAAR